MTDLQGNAAGNQNILVQDRTIPAYAWEAAREGHERAQREEQRREAMRSGSSDRA